MSDPFQPSWLRALIVVAVATAAFFVPQEIPLEYYPLNNPSGGLQYIEITCAANFNGETRLYPNFGRKFSELECIHIPIGPSEMAFTYTFPLVDGPLVALRLDPLRNAGGELTITNFRIINRREEEIARFTKDSFHRMHQIAEIVPLEKGWKFVISPGSVDPYAYVRLEKPLIPEGMNERNLKRCLLSTGYLTMMLWIILLAVYFALRLFTTKREVLRAMAFMALMAAAFSVVGNRGLIKNSCFYAAKAAKIQAAAGK